MRDIVVSSGIVHGSAAASWKSCSRMVRSGRLIQAARQREHSHQSSAHHFG